MSELKLGVQLYTLRDQMDKDFFGTLEQVKALGIHYVELAGLGGNSAEKVKSELDRIGLVALGAHAGMDFATGDISQQVSDAKTIGYKYVVQPWIGEEHYKDGWAGFAKKVEPVAKKLKEQGLQFLYHNHSFEFKKEADGRFGLDVFYATADPELVGAEIDTYWVQHGGDDPAAFVRKLKGRVPCVHLKDMSPDADQHFVEGGKGVLDWDAILQASKDAGAEYGIIELDTSPGDPLECVKTSAEYFRSKGVSH